MMQAERHSTPRPRDVLAAQIKAVGFALLRPARAVLALAALVTVIIAIDVFQGEVIAFHPEHNALPGVLGLLFPVAVWMGEERFGSALLWTFPVDRRWHALARVVAGWVWMIGAVALFVIWLLVLALVSDGSVVAEETLLVLPSFSFTAQGTFPPEAVQHVPWTPNPLFWLVPFTAATGTYLLSSAIALATRYPLRWIVGTFLGLLLLVTASGPLIPNGRVDADRVMRSLVGGPYGLDALFTAHTESLQVAATLSTGETMVVWRRLPDLGQWATATLLWISIGAAGVAAAVSRHRETRRA